ncbi:hypothetical protein [Staphylococcus capitis]|uniref:hypothetical protein n=1 Tax=Staphylococcus capitis TaxID=29388 RepID=UPI0002DA6CBD|nr:hypothetical protein [Staphylococcus capitis]MDZ5507055.1 hypothetical protein [Staphylococcus capitis]GGI36861.1 hypothetical protein GCM10008141_14700 [Staphylococcus capitis]
MVLVVLSNDNPSGNPVTVVLTGSELLSVTVTLIGDVGFPTSIVGLLTLIVGFCASLNL